ncbi:MAG: hypothetical protein R6T83_07160 [Salinibacter sp.]
MMLRLLSFPSLPPAALLLSGLLLCLLSFGSPPAAAQSENVTTVEGPNDGENTTLTAQPHSLADGLSARAIGISAPDTTRWGLRLIGADDAESIEFRQAGDPLPITRIDRPGEDDAGPTSVYVDQETFLLMAETSTIALRVGTARVELPEALRREMKQIFETVTDE